MYLGKTRQNRTNRTKLNTFCPRDRPRPLKCPVRYERSVDHSGRSNVSLQIHRAWE